MTTDVLVIGSGMAGSVAALTAADAGSAVVLITKTDAMVSGNTHHAQGGIVFRGTGDSPERLKADILAAGAGHCYEPAVDLFCREGPDLVQRLLIDRLEVPFAHTSKGDEYHRTSEAAHSVPRILHAKDQTGQALERAIIDVTAKHPRITSLSGRTAIDLLTTSHHSANLQDTYRLPRCFGALFFNQATGKVEPVFARQTILATGGIGRLYLHTTNPVEARGDGIAMAWRAGARCVNLHYIQFHPTALYHESGRFLISEAVRGEGGILVDGDGREFMNRFHPDGNLAPRDVVARGIHQTMIEQKITSVYLDITHKSSKWIKDRFPAIYARCKSIGLDMAREPIPVVPAAHFSCGGVAVDLDGQTSIADLFAVGEVSCTGLHGANRLASTALLECLVWGRQAGQAAAQATQAKKDAETDRRLAAEELKRAETTISETEQLCQQMQAEARRQASEIEAKAQRGAEVHIQNAQAEAEAVLSELKRNVAEEVRSILEEITTIRDVARHEMETQRILTGAARLVTHAANIWTLNDDAVARPDVKRSPDASSTSGAAGTARRRGRPGGGRTAFGR